MGSCSNTNLDANQQLDRKIPIKCGGGKIDPGWTAVGDAHCIYPAE